SCFRTEKSKMMEGQNGKDPPYSVETPYGFRLDLDFLKYVDDIEKGNTIKRVPIQRRSKGPRASTLPRHINPSGYSYRPSPWGSTGALGPKSRLSDTHHHGYTSWACDHRSPLSPTGLKSLAEMEAKIKEFDEQPLGEHIRPNLLRASSLPLTVLLRQGSESVDDPGSLQSSRDHLSGRNTSCEDVFYSLDSPRPQDCSGLLRRLTEALERVGELELEVRVIPELRAQICILQEERERLRLGLNPHCYPFAVNGNTDTHNLSHHGAVEIKRPQHENHIKLPRNHSTSHDEFDPAHEWRTSTDLDELLTVTSLQAKVAVLEQKLHEAGLDLQRALGLLREQQEESRRKDEKIENLRKNPAMWVRAERVVVDQDGDETLMRSTQPNNKKVSSSRGPDSLCSARTVNTKSQTSQLQDFAVSSMFTERSSPVSADPGEASAEDTAMVIHHIKKIKRYLDQQWECLCGGSREEGKPLRHPDPKVNALQEEMMGLVNILTSHYAQHAPSDGGMIQHGGTTALRSVLYVRVRAKSGISGRMKPQPPGEQMEVYPGAETTTGSRLDDQNKCLTSVCLGNVTVMFTLRGISPTKHVFIASHGKQIHGLSFRETMSADFLAACQFLSDHMDNMENPNEEMVRTLPSLLSCFVVLCLCKSDSKVALYLREVKKCTPSLLAFLVNLEDDNSNTVLHYSISHCNYSIVSLLLDTGVSDVNLQNNAGYTAVMLASLTAPDVPGGMEVVRKLMELSNINIRSSKTGQTALHLAVRHGRVVMVRLLLSYGADANIQDNQGTTALMFACERGHTHIARLLLERSQCDLALTDKHGQTALSIAMQGSHTDTAALLQAHAKARAL
uniref:Uncharacterized protein n=1 Tax=Anabas testudineus TaxID=64144 RepID=A0A3Q1H297_ANATE